MRNYLRFVTLLALITFKIDCSATPQTGDLLIINQDTLVIHQYPLDKFFNKGNFFNPQFFDVLSTACARGYIAVWIVQDNKLFLKDIYDCDFSRKIPIDKIGRLHNNQGLILADWFCSSIKVNKQTKEEITGPWNLGRLFICRIRIKILNGQVEIS